MFKFPVLIDLLSTIPCDNTLKPFSSVQSRPRYSTYSVTPCAVTAAHLSTVKSNTTNANINNNNNTTRPGIYE